MKYFILFKKQTPDQKQNDYSIVEEDTLQEIPEDIILAKKQIEDIGPDGLTKEMCKSLVEELGGTFYGN